MLPIADVEIKYFSNNLLTNINKESLHKIINTKSKKWKKLWYGKKLW